MSITDASRIADNAPLSTQGYWEDPAAEQNLLHSPADLDQNPVDPASVEPPLLRTLLPLGATGIDGNQSNPGGRTVEKTPDGKDVQVDPLHQGTDVSIARERTIAEAGLGQTYVSSDQLVFATGGGNDQVGVSQRDDGTLDVTVNGESYEVRLADGQEFTIRTGAGDDVIEVASNVTVNIVAEGGEGDDKIAIAGSGDNRVDAGDGNDSVDLASATGRNDVFGGSGDDIITGGSGVDVIYGGDGNDTIDGGTGRNYLEGGAGNDAIRSRGTGDMVSGGLGDDTIHAASGASSVYAGAGSDTIEGAGDQTTVYAEATDLINAATGARPTVVNVEIDASVGSSVTVEGSDAFVQRVQADIEFLRSSPNGQQMLAEFDKTAETKGNRVTIKELSNEQNGYAMPAEDGATWADVQITNGRAGGGVETDIRYNPSFHMDAFPAPVVVLYHEMSHAYNFTNGTLQPGNYSGPDTADRGISNSERQAVGLETSAPAYDFDGDPSTPATTHNPFHLTENGLREELGLPARPSYRL